MCTGRAALAGLRIASAGTLAPDFLDQFNSTIRALRLDNNSLEGAQACPTRHVAAIKVPEARAKALQYVTRCLHGLCSCRQRAVGHSERVVGDSSCDTAFNVLQALCRRSGHHPAYLSSGCEETLACLGRFLPRGAAALAGGNPCSRHAHQALCRRHPVLWMQSETALHTPCTSRRCAMTPACGTAAAAAEASFFTRAHSRCAARAAPCPAWIPYTRPRSGATRASAAPAPSTPLQDPASLRHVRSDPLSQCLA